MTARAAFKQSDVSRLLKAAKREGFGDVRVDVDPSGRLSLLTGKLAANDPPNPWDEGPEE